MFFSDVAAENRHGADAEAQRKKRLIHRGDNGSDDAGFLHPLEIGEEIKFQTGASAF